MHPSNDEFDEAAEGIAGAIDQLERAIDGSLAQLGRLLHDLAAGRASSRLSASYAHDVFEATVPALTSIVAARTSAVNIHKRLTVVQRHQGITLSIPPTDKGPTFAAASPLQVVSSSAA